MPEAASRQIDSSSGQLKICFIGNTNNYPYLVAHAMRRMGHDVTLLLDRPEGLHRPQGRYADLDLPTADTWVRDISQSVTVERWQMSRSEELSSSRLRGYDLLVLNGYGLALAGGQGTPSFAMLTGSDLTQLANWASVAQLWRALKPSLGFARRAIACLLQMRTVALQRRGIRRSFGVSYFVRGVVPEADRVLEGMGIDAERRISFMLSDVDHIQPQPIPYLSDSKAEFRVFNVARLNWRHPKPAHMSELDMKGTDVLLAGFAAFTRRSKTRASLVLVRKGVDIEATEGEVERLGIKDKVIWLDEMSQAEVFHQYAIADVVTEQLSTSYVGMGGLDAMAAGRPVIANTRPDARGEGLLVEDAPVLHASSPDDVCQHLLMLAESRECTDSLGARSRAYVEKHHSPQAAARRIIEMRAAMIQHQTGMS